MRRLEPPSMRRRALFHGIHSSKDSNRPHPATVSFQDSTCLRFSLAKKASPTQNPKPPKCIPGRFIATTLPLEVNPLEKQVEQKSCTPPVVTLFPKAASRARRHLFSHPVLSVPSASAQKTFLLTARSTPAPRRLTPPAPTASSARSTPAQRGSAKSVLSSHPKYVPPLPASPH